MDRASGGGCSPVSEEISSVAIGEISGTLSETYGFYGFLLDFIEFSPPYPDINSPEAVVLYWIYHDLSISDHFSSRGRSPDDWQQDWWYLH